MYSLQYNLPFEQLKRDLENWLKICKTQLLPLSRARISKLKMVCENQLNLDGGMLETIHLQFDYIN